MYARNDYRWRTERMLGMFGFCAVVQHSDSPPRQNCNFRTWRGRELCLTFYEEDGSVVSLPKFKLKSQDHKTQI